MGLLAGRDPYGWPKKMADITWLENRTKKTWSIVVNKQKDQGNFPLMVVEYQITDKPSTVEWPDMGPTLLLRRIPPAAINRNVLNTMICVGCSRLEDAGIPLIGSGPGSKPQRNTTNTTGTATVRFMDGPNDPLSFLGPIKVLDAKMSIMEGIMPGGLSLGEILDEWESER